MIIPHIRDIFICGILGHYHKWLIFLKKIVEKVLTIGTIWIILSKQSRLKRCVNGVLAQLGEHLPYKQRVTGSSPVGPIILAE